MNRDMVLAYLQEHKDEFKKHFGVVKLGLFGSLARGDATPQSDIDILIELQKGTHNLYEKKQQLKEILEKAFNQKVDIAREKYLKPFAKESILKEVVYV